MPGTQVPGTVPKAGLVAPSVIARRPVGTMTGQRRIAMTCRAKQAGLRAMTSRAMSVVISAWCVYAHVIYFETPTAMAQTAQLPQV